MDRIKYIIFLIGICAIIGCKDKPKTAKQTTPEKYCVLETDTVAFKGLKIGMSSSEFKNIKKKYFPYSSITISNGVTTIDTVDAIDKIPNVVTYQVINTEKYSMFEKNTRDIFLRFYKDKLFHIRISTAESIIFELAEKFNATGCINNWDRTDDIWINQWLNLKSKKLEVNCTSSQQENWSILDIYDRETKSRINALQKEIEKETEEREKKRKLKDF